MVKKGKLPVKKKTDRSALVMLAGILIFTCLLYLPSLRGEFLNYDDTENVVNNVLIHHISLDMLRQCFSRAILYMYTPLTYISYAFDYHVLGPDPFIFKLTNLLLHLLNSALLFFLARRLFKNNAPAALLSLLFAVHPMNADSVSWISARSNLLSVMFFIVSLLLYIQYLKEKRILFFILIAISYLFSLLSKTAGIMLPLVLLLIDYLTRRNITARVILEKIPLFIIGIAFGLVTIYFRSDTGNPQSVMEYNLFDRFLMFFHSIAGYLVRSVLPVNLSPIYAYPVKNGDFLPMLFYIAPLLLAGMIFLVSRMKILKREMIFGLLFFLVNVVITQAVMLEDGFMANRYGYLPCIGLFFIIAAVFDHVRQGPKRRKTVTVVSLSMLLVAFSVMTWQRSQVWKTTLSLFSDAVKHSPGSAFAFNNLGIALYTANDMEGAISDYNQAIRLFPRYSGAYYNRGMVWYALQEFDKARADYDKAIELNPGFATCYTARGILEMDVMQNGELALSDYNKAISLNPFMAQAYYNRGILRLRMNDIGQACEDFHQVRRLGFDRADKLIKQFCE
jgi:tetratricopeptide (TPR) repeat protein